jgi:F-type H+-transporting ATPase subunit delta
VARVISATPLSDDQQARLVAALNDMYGRKISLRTAVDADVKGGLVVRVGDEVIDGSIATRLGSARAALAG